MKRTLLYGAGAAGLLLVGLPVSAWVFRTDIASWYLNRYCADRGVTCEGQVSRLDRGMLILSDARLSTDTGIPFAAREIEVGLGWPGIVTPRVDGLTIRDPVIRAQIEEGEIGFHDLPLGEGETGGGLPDFPYNLSGGRIEIETDAGLVSGRFDASGRSSGDITMEFELDPARLSQGSSAIDLNVLSGQFTFIDGTLQGNLVADIPTLSLPDLTIDDTRVLATLRHGSGEGEFEWSVTSEELSHAQIRTRGLVSEGRVRVEGELSPDALSLAGLGATVEVDALTTRELRTERVVLSLDLADVDEEGARGSYAFEGESVVADGAGRLGKALVTGDIAYRASADSNSSLEISGTAVLERAGLGSQHIERALKTLVLPEPLTLHGDALGDILADALRSVDGVVQFTADLEGLSLPGEGEGGAPELTLVIDDDLRLKAASGLTLELSSGPGRSDVMRWRRGELDLAGSLQASGGGLPSLSARRVDAVQDERGRLLVGFDDLWLEAWEVGDRSLGLRFETLDVRRSAGRERETMAVTAKGRVDYTGELPGGFGVTGLQVAGPLDARSAPEGWRVQVLETGCLDVAVETLGYAAFTARDVAAEACSPDGRLLRRDGTVPVGELGLARLDLPFAVGGVTGRTRLSDVTLDWRLDEGLSFVAGSGAIDSRVRVDQEAVTFTGAGSRLVFSTTDDTLMAGQLTQVRAATTALPLNFAAPEIDFVSLDGAGTPGLALTFSDLVASDQIMPQRFANAQLSGETKVTAERVLYDGRLATARRGVDLGRLSIRHDIAANRGELTLDGADISFAPFRFQPTDITDFLRGVAVDARGSVTPQARVSWQGGEIESEGALSVKDLSFDTFRLGSVAGVSGDIAFTSLTPVRTAPGQMLRVGRIGIVPNLPLEDGTLSFQVLSPTSIVLEEAGWPFLGGELRIDETRWRRGSDTETVVVTADTIDIGSLIRRLDLPELKAEGLVSGRFPVEVSGSNVYVRNARLDAIGDGVIRYEGAIGESAGQADDYARLAFDALKNFRYDILSVGLDGNLADTMTLSVALAGQNPDVLDGQAFNLNLGIETKLVQLLNSGRLVIDPNSALTRALDVAREAETAPATEDDN